jgi:hypothetical protein
MVCENLQKTWCKIFWESSSVGFQFLVISCHFSWIYVIFFISPAENLVQDILGEFQCEVSKPYLFYRNNGEVSGIWFFNETECDEVVTLIQRCASRDLDAHTPRIGHPHTRTWTPIHPESNTRTPGIRHPRTRAHESQVRRLVFTTRRHIKTKFHDTGGSALQQDFM